MRIVHVGQSYPPMISGAALVMQRLARAQAVDGHTVTVVAASVRGPAERSLTDGICVVRLPSLPNPCRARQRFILWAAPALRAALLAAQPQVIHLHEPLSLGLTALGVARQLRCPTVLSLHALPNLLAAYVPPVLGARRLVEGAMWAYGRAFARRCTALVAGDASGVAAVRAHLGHAPQLIPDGVDGECFNPHPRTANEGGELRRAYGLDPHLPVILHVGRLDFEKQAAVVVKAAAGALQAGLAQLLIVGDGTQRAALAALSQDLGIAERTHLVGFVPPGDTGDLPGLYRLATVFITASEVETEGLVVIEAAVSGLPVVAVRATSLPNLVDDGRTGYLAAPRDVAGLDRHLRALVSDPERARAMGQAGRAKLRESHALTRSVAAYDALYRQLADSLWRQPQLAPGQWLGGDA